MLRLAIFAGTCLVLGCPSNRPEPPRVPDDSALRVRIAQAEARRAGGLADLTELAQSSDAHARELALRGLGRVGGAQAQGALEQALGDKDPKVVEAALYAIGVAAALDEDATWKPGPKIVAVLSRAPVPALEALGRAGDASNQGELIARLADKNPAVARTAALALGRLGRRKIAWQPDARAALVVATKRQEPGVQYAATYALSREHEPPADEAVNAALAARVTDNDPMVRAVAIAGLAKRKALGAARKDIDDSLRDRDWRVAVEAVRALAGANGDETGRIAVTSALAQRLGELRKGSLGEAQVITEGLRTLLANPTNNQAAVASVLHIGQEAGGDTSLAPLTRGWIECLAVAAAAAMNKGATDWVSSLTTCGHGGLPDPLRLPLIAELVNAKVGDANARRAALRVLLGHADPRVRAAGLTTLPASWPDGDDKARATLIGTVSSALATKDPIVAGTAVDVAGDLYEAMGAEHPLRATLDAAVIARAKTETEIELSSSLYALIGKRAIAGGADACRAGLTTAPAREKAAADCLHALGEATTPPPAGPAEVPKLDVTRVIGKKLFWHLATTRGEIVIELRPDVAPWAVASIVTLTEKGFYDGIEFHRVVPDFVVQGGDPTQSGWGGPGYTLPAEPAASLDGAGFVTGGVGIADAGKDSGGSQWFIMHSHAPHLDGRYTWIGSVATGQKSADALLIGDRVEKATIEQR